MELLDRYLHAVKFWLPGPQQADIIAELAEDIRSQIDDRETELGHKLDESEVAAILKQVGQPMLVAGRYLPQQHLIGPLFLPVYRFVLKLVLLWILVPVFVVIVGPIEIATAANPGPALIKALWSLATAAVFAFGLITLIFTAVERYPHKSLEKWDPRRLPRVPATKAASGVQTTPRSVAIAELVMGVVIGLGWLSVMWSRTAFDLEGVRITLAPVWQSVFWPILVVSLGGVPLGWASLVWPSWTRLRSGIRLTINGVSLALVAVLLKAGTWVEVAAPHLPAAGVAEAAKWTNLGVRITLLIILIATVVDTIQEIRRILRRKTMASSAILSAG
jgi:hypothetical protein